MKILVAEDNLFFRYTLETMLREWGYEVVAVEDGVAALEVFLKPNAPKLAIIDWVMPRMDGLELCRHIRALHRPEPPYLIMLTSKTSKEDIVAALDAGADDYVAKPFDREVLQARLRVGARVVGLQMSETAVYVFARAVEAKSPFTRGHSERVAFFALAMARRLGLDADDLETLRKGALLHDIGKIAVPDGVLNKIEPLTANEIHLMRQHPEQGVRIVEPMDSLADVIPLIRWHHERLDGSGYPDGLHGDQIPLLVRILAVADCYDAMSSQRPYRNPYEHDGCLRELREEADAGRLDPTVVECFAQLSPISPSLRDSLEEKIRMESSVWRELLARIA